MSAEPFYFLTECDRMLLALRFVAELDLDGITDAVENAHALGPIVDPTNYRDALQRGDLDTMARLARALREPVRLYREMVAARVPA